MSRRPLRVMSVGVAAGFVAVAACWGLAVDAEKLRGAKALVFDGRYAEARTAWQEILGASSEPEASEAAYWVAHCSEKLEERERAFREYGQFLARKPSGPLVLQARTSRVSLAARLYQAGRKDYLAVLKDALADSDRTVRYFAALQLSELGRDVGQPALAVLKEILEKEKDDDLKDRAKLGLLKIAPEVLTQMSPPATPRPGGRPSWVKLRIFKKGEKTANVTVNMPLALAELIFKSLPDEARTKLKREGVDADNFWKRLRGLGTQEILKIETDEGELVQIWLE